MDVFWSIIRGLCALTLFVASIQTTKVGKYKIYYKDKGETFPCGSEINMHGYSKLACVIEQDKWDWPNVKIYKDDKKRGKVPVKIVETLDGEDGSPYTFSHVFRTVDLATLPPDKAGRQSHLITCLAEIPSINQALSCTLTGNWWGALKLKREINIPGNGFKLGCYAYGTFARQVNSWTFKYKIKNRQHKKRAELIKDLATYNTSARELHEASRVPGKIIPAENEGDTSDIKKGWGPWTDWNECRYHCDTGHIQRERYCKPPDANTCCVGQSKQTKSCLAAEGDCQRWASKLNFNMEEYAVVYFKTPSMDISDVGRYICHARGYDFPLWATFDLQICGIPDMSIVSNKHFITVDCKTNKYEWYMPDYVSEFHCDVEEGDSDYYDITWVDENNNKLQSKQSQLYRDGTMREKLIVRHTVEVKASVSEYTCVVKDKRQYPNDNCREIPQLIKRCSLYMEGSVRLVQEWNETNRLLTHRIIKQHYDEYSGSITYKPASGEPERTMADFDQNGFSNIDSSYKAPQTVDTFMMNNPLDGDYTIQLANGGEKRVFTVERTVDGVWGPWEAWSALSVTCGRGLVHRRRLCNRGGQGRMCLGHDSEDKIMSHAKPCRVNGGWGNWGDWTLCSATCGTGWIQRQRSCDFPPPEGGGNDCPGDKCELKGCKLRQCAGEGEDTNAREDVEAVGRDTGKNVDEKQGFPIKTGSNAEVKAATCSLSSRLGIGVGTGIAVVALIVAASFFYTRRKSTYTTRIRELEEQVRTFEDHQTMSPQVVGENAKVVKIDKIKSPNAEIEMKDFKRKDKDAPAAEQSVSSIVGATKSPSPSFAPSTGYRV